MARTSLPSGAGQSSPPRFREASGRQTQIPLTRWKLASGHRAAKASGMRGGRLEHLLQQCAVGPRGGLPDARAAPGGQGGWVGAAGASLPCALHAAAAAGSSAAGLATRCGRDIQARCWGCSVVIVQRRRGAAREMGVGSPRFWCPVHQGISLASERTFLRLYFPHL